MNFTLKKGVLTLILCCLMGQSVSAVSFVESLKSFGNQGTQYATNSMMWFLKKMHTTPQAVESVSQSANNSPTNLIIENKPEIPVTSEISAKEVIGNVSGANPSDVPVINNTLSPVDVGSGVKPELPGQGTPSGSSANFTGKFSSPGLSIQFDGSKFLESCYQKMTLSNTAMGIGLVVAAWAAWKTYGYYAMNRTCAQWEKNAQQEESLRKKFLVDRLCFLYEKFGDKLFEDAGSIGTKQDIKKEIENNISHYHANQNSISSDEVISAVIAFVHNSNGKGEMASKIHTHVGELSKKITNFGTHKFEFKGKCLPKMKYFDPSWWLEGSITRARWLFWKYMFDYVQKKQ
jgi:hypothetical protein